MDDKTLLFKVNETDIYKIENIATNVKYRLAVGLGNRSSVQLLTDSTNKFVSQIFKFYQICFCQKVYEVIEILK